MGTRSLSPISVQAKLTTTIQNLLDASSTGTVAVDVGDTITKSPTSGTAADKADRCWTDKGRTLTSGNSEDIDVYDFGSLDIGAGAGLDPLGQALALAEIVAMLIQNSSASAGDLVVGGKGTTAAWNSLFNADDDAVLVIKPGGFVLLYAPTDPAYAVADTANHLLKMAASGGDVTYDIHILGRSA